MALSPAERGARVEADPHGREGGRDSGLRRLSHQLNVVRKSGRARYDKRDARKQQTLPQHVSPPKMRYVPRRLSPMHDRFLVPIGAFELCPAGKIAPDSNGVLD